VNVKKKWRSLRDIYIRKKRELHTKIGQAALKIKIQISPL
jgi:hypothetical protein